MSEPLKSALAEKGRRKKVWSSEDQILAAIEKKKDFIAKKTALAMERRFEAKRLAIEAEEFDEESCKAPTKALRERAATSAAYARQKCRKAEDEAKKADKAIDRAQNKALPRLGQALAAMQTATMPEVIGRYKGVVV